MNHIRSAALENCRHLPNHHRLLSNAFQFFHQRPGILGGFVHGAAASGGLHAFSSLDVGLLCSSASERDGLWKDRSGWKMAPWIQYLRDESPYHVTYFSQPSVHLEFRFYTLEDLPAASAGPFTVAWDHRGPLDAWAQQALLLQKQGANWNEVVSEDEQFWAWTHFSTTFAARGEYHEVVGHLEDLREIVQNWQTRLDQMARKNMKLTGNRFHPEFLDRMKRTFCPPHAEGIKLAFRNLIKIQLQQRALIDRTVSPRWTVSLPTISKIQTCSQTFAS